MVAIQSVIPACRVFSRWASLLPVVLTLACGCNTVDPKLVKEVPPMGTPTNIIATWHPNVESLPDRLQGGRPTPAVCGRVFLLQGDTPVVAKDGRLVVSLYDEHPKLAQNGTPIPLDIWEITPECLKLVQVKDAIGWGYTLNLPWGSYRPEIGMVEMRVEYRPSDPTTGELPSFTQAQVTFQNNGANAQYAMKPHFAGNPLAGMQIPTGYGQQQPANRSALEMSYQVNSAGNMVAQPQSTVGNQQGVVQAQAVGGPGAAQPFGGQPPAPSQNQPQGFGLPPQGSVVPNANAQGPGQLPPGQIPQGQTVFTPNSNMRIP